MTPTDDLHPLPALMILVIIAAAAIAILWRMTR